MQREYHDIRCTWDEPVNSLTTQLACCSHVMLELTKCAKKLTHNLLSKPTREGGTLYARARVSLVSREGGSHAVLFMVPLGPPGARPMAQALRLSFEYYYFI